MKSEIIPFFWEENVVRIVKDSENKPWFVAKDVAGALGYTNPQKAIRDHCTRDVSLEESGIVTPGSRGERIVHPPLDPQTKIIPEPDVYRLIIRSKLPGAEKFEAWVFEEVLPTIRKTGGYQMPGTGDPRFMDDACVKRSGNMYFPMAKLVESADKYLEGKAALKALNYFTGMPVDDLLAELDEKQFSAGFGSEGMAHKDLVREAIAAWISNKCDVGDDYMAQAGVMYRAFCDWMPGNCSLERPVTMKAFGMVMSRIFKRRKEGVVYYLGVRLSQPGGEVYDDHSI